jgi:hypothetical protein
MLIIIYVTFKRHNGTYFWSTIITTLGIATYNTGNLITYFENSSPRVLANLFWHIGYGVSTTGLALVLWSRLHLVVNNRRLLQCLLVVIPFNGVVINFSAIGVLFGLTLKYNKVYVISIVLNYMGVITIVVIETILSSLYIFHTTRFLRSGYKPTTRKIIGLLLCVQLLVIIFDAMLWSLVFTNLLQVATQIHPLIQSFKLKLEFIILNQLTDLVQHGGFVSTRDEESQIGQPDQELGPQPSPKPNTPFQISEPSTVTSTKFPKTSALGIQSVTDMHITAKRQEMRHIDHDPPQILQGKEISARKPDEILGQSRNSMEDLDRRYLGNWRRGI